MKKVDQTKRVYLAKLTDDRMETMQYMGQINDRFGVYKDLANSTKNYQWYHLIDMQKRKVAVDLPLARTSANNQECWHPEYTRTDCHYRGQNLALQLYAFVLTQGVIIRAGRSQSVGSTKLWYKLSKIPGVEVWAADYTGEWTQCEPCDDTQQIDTPCWDPYQRDCKVIATYSGPYAALT